MPHAQPELVEGPGAWGRKLFFAQISGLADWPISIVEPEGHFVLFVAADVTDAPDADLEAFARKLVTQGAVYTCAWGPGCRRLHHSFDAADIALNPESDADHVILTTDHADESLDEALWEALFSAWPAATYESTCNSLLAIAVASDEWASAIRRRLEDPDQIR